MDINNKVFAFEGDIIPNDVKFEYKIEWSKFQGIEQFTRITIYKGNGDGERLRFYGENLPTFIKELQMLCEFMKSNGLLIVEDDEENLDKEG